MAITFGFYDSKNGDRKYNAKQFSSIFDGIIMDGVFMTIGGQMAVKTANSGMQVNVQTGRAWFDHTWTLVDSIYPLILPNPEVLLDKWVAVVLEVNSSQAARRNIITYVAGTPATNPVYPTLTNTDTLHQHPLAYVKIRSGATVISQADIVNVVGTSTTPYVTGPLQTVNADTLLAQWRGEFADMIAADNTVFRNMINTDTSQWNNFFNGTQNSWDTYFASTKSNWNAYKSGVETQWNNYYSAVNNEWTTDKNRINSEWNTFYNNTDATWNAFYNRARTNWDGYLTGVESQWNTYFQGVGNQWDTFIDRSETNFNNFLEAKDDEFHEDIEAMQTEFSSFWEDFKRGMTEYLAEQKTIWEEWFSHMRGQLSEDAATRLQMEIDALAYVYVARNRAVLSIVGWVLDNRVTFGTWASVSGRRLTLAQPPANYN